MNNHLAFGTALLSVILMSCSSANESGNANAPAGMVAGFSHCKSSLEAGVTDTTLPNQDCLEYQYDGDSVLLLKHVNAAFNCCPDSFGAAFSFAGQLITIEEAERLTNPCDCLCLFDLNLRIVDLVPGTYTIKVKEPYLWEGAGVLEFTVDLRSSPSGSYCVARNRYPWGTP
jgi:hypothetical protein